MFSTCVLRILNSVDYVQFSIRKDTYDQEWFIHIYITFCVCGCVDGNNSPNFTGKNGVQNPFLCARSQRHQIFTGRNEVVAKVIFLHLFVILFTGGWCAWSGGGVSHKALRQTPPDQAHPPDQTHHPPRPGTHTPPPPPRPVTKPPHPDQTHHPPTRHTPTPLD